MDPQIHKNTNTQIHKYTNTNMRHDSTPRDIFGEWIHRDQMQMHIRCISAEYKKETMYTKENRLHDLCLPRLRNVLIVGVVMLIPTVIVIRTLMRTKESGSPHRSRARTVAAPFVPGKQSTKTLKYCPTINYNIEKKCNNETKY